MSDKVQPGDIFRFVGRYFPDEDYYMIIGPKSGVRGGWEMMIVGKSIIVEYPPWDEEKNLTDPDYYVKVA